MLLLLGAGTDTLTGSPSTGDGVYFEALDVWVLFEVSESQPFAATQVWHDFSPYLHAASPLTTNRGRSYELDEVRAGTLGCTLDATNGDLDPRNLSSPVADCLKPRRQCRLRIIDSDDTVYPIFRGFSHGFPRVYEQPNVRALVPFAATDGFRVMGNADPTGGLLTLDDPILGRLGVGRLGGETVDAQLSGSLVNALLDTLRWPADLRDIDAGNVSVAGDNLAQRGLAAIQDAARAEGGEVYIDAAGNVRLRDRFARYTETRSTVVQATFYPRAQDPPVPTFSGPFRIEHDETRIINSATYTGASGTPLTATDPDSIDEYGICDDTQTLIAVEDLDVYGLAQLAVLEHAEPSDRFEELIVPCHGSNRTVAKPAVLGRELFDLIALELEPTYGGSETIPAVVQGIELSLSQDALVGTFRLGPHRTYDFFTLDDPDRGVLDEDVLGV